MAIRLTRIYTRTGDSGETGLVGGRRVPKDSLRIEAYGTVDELNACVGLARAFNQETLRHLPRGARGRGACRRLEDILRRIQNELFDLGSELATSREDEYKGMWHVGKEEARLLEKIMDECQKDLKPLNSFVLPGGGVVSAHLHQCRTVCRRAEREVLRLMRTEETGPGPLRYVNRLSDLFFVLSRWMSLHLGEEEYLWERGLRGTGGGKGGDNGKSGSAKGA